MLDFDNARYEARILDLAIALHDFARVFGERGSPDSRFLWTWRSYRSSWALTCRPTRWSWPKSWPFPLCSPRDRSRGPSAVLLDDRGVRRFARTREEDGPGDRPRAPAGSPRTGVAEGAAGTPQAAS